MDSMSLFYFTAMTFASGTKSTLMILESVTSFISQKPLEYV